MESVRFWELRLEFWFQLWFWLAGFRFLAPSPRLENQEGLKQIRGFWGKDMNSVLKNRNNLEEEEEMHASQRQKTYGWVVVQKRESNEKVYPKRPPSRSIHVTVNSTGTGSCQDMQGLTEGLKSQARRTRQWAWKPFEPWTFENIIKADDPFQKSAQVYIH